MTLLATCSNNTRIAANMQSDYQEILTPQAIEFLSTLAAAFEPRRQDLLERRKARQAELDRGVLPDFLAETRAIRQASWTVAPIPSDLRDRRVEITGPVDRK